MRRTIGLLGGGGPYWLPVLVAVLSLVGIGVAGYLTYVHWFDKPIACAGFGTCAEVAQSDYAWIGGVPVAFLGLLGYVALTAVGAFWLRVGRPLRRLAAAGDLGDERRRRRLLRLPDLRRALRHRRRLHLVRDVGRIMTVIFLAATGGLLTLGRDSELLSG